MKTIPIEVANEVLKAVYGPETTSTEQSTGNPSHQGRELNPKGFLASLGGIVLPEVSWDTDRGNWMWDGAMATLKALGYDVSKPVV